jgi:hypothetical protein
MLAEKYGLPKPVSADKLTKVETDPNHGLWGFFRDHRNALSTPEQEFSHGMLPRECAGIVDEGLKEADIAL